MQYVAPADLLKDKIILVTGAGDGIGKAAAKTYAKHGATVVLLGRTTQKLENVYDEIIAEKGVQPAIYPLNLEGASPKDYADLANTIEDEFGALHGLLHNAAMFGAASPIQHHDVDLWYKVMQINVNAAFLMTRALLPLLVKTDDARIVFTTDDKTQAYWGAYGTSKAAIDGLMKILADELDTENPVRVNSIYPGPVRTRLRARAFPGENPNTLKMPDDIMPAYLYAMGSDCEKKGEIIQAQ
ncbi:MAG: YciK family oxidoreductase [Gammaproteobacteria bacterium]|nr:YciK family oxidoreductase [Gammaproteobacteria bacterium]